MSGNRIGEAHPILSEYCEIPEDVPAARNVRPCTVKDVARLAGVSQATVSRVVNGANNVSGKTRTRVMTAVSNLQYCPNAHAAELGRANGGISRKRGD
jgi:predicted transcriptional regulator